MARPKFARWQPDRIPSDLTRPGAGARVSGVLRDLVAWAQGIDAEDSSSTVVTVASLPDEGNYFLLAGRAANQEAYGGTSTTGYLWLQSSSGATASTLARIQVTSTPDIIFDIPSGSLDPFQFSLGLASGTFTSRVVAHSLLGSGGASSTWTLNNTSGAAATVLAKIIAHASQSGDVFVYYASDGSTVNFGVDSDGDIYRQGAGTFNYTAGEHAFSINAGPTDMLVVGNGVHINRDHNMAATGTRLTVHGTSGQTGHYFECHNVSDVVVFQVDGTGRVGIGGDPTTNVFLDVTGGVKLRANTLTTLTSSPVAYDIGSGAFYRQAATGTRNIRGIAGGDDGRLLIWKVTGSTAYGFTHLDAGASAENRIRISTGANLTASLNSVYLLIYDAVDSQWFLQKWAEPGGTETISGAWTWQNTLTIQQDSGGRLDIVDTSGAAQPFIRFTDSGFNLDLTAGNLPLTADRAVYLPDATDTLVGKATTDNLTNKDLKITCLFESSTQTSGVNFYDTTTATKKLRFVLSGAVGNNAIVCSTTAARTWTLADEQTQVVLVGNTAVTEGNAAAAGTPGKFDATAQTSDVASTTLVTTPTAGMWLVHYYIDVTTADAAAGTLTLTYSYTDDSGAVTQTATVALTSASAYARGTFVLYSTTANQSFTIVNGGAYGTAAFAAHLRAVFLG